MQTQIPVENKVNWSVMTDAELRFQINCFERHEDRIPDALFREWHRRDLSRKDWRDQGEIAMGA